MRRLWELFQNNRFRNKMAITYVFMALIPLVIFAAVSAGVFLSQARQTTMAHTAQITGQVSNSIDMYISTIDKMADYLTCMLQRSGMLEDAAAWERMQTPVSSTLSDIARSHPEIAGILIATEQDDSVSTGMSRISRDPFTSENWYRLASTEPDRVVLVGSTTGRNIVTKQDYSADNVFSLAKAVKDRRTGEVRGVILFDVSHEIITDSIKNVTIGEKGFVFVVDSDDNMVFTPVNEIVYRVDPAWLDGDAGVPVTAQIAGGRYQIRYEQSGFTGWKTVGVFSLDEVMGGINTIVYVLILCIVGTGALVLFVSLQLANSVTKPISKLQKLMKQAESGDLSVRFNSLYSDEIGDLGHSFNHMIHRIDHLIHRVYEEQQSKRDAELKSLQEQIKPHFLYNTLDTISWMARDYGADDIVRLVDALTSMFRIGLSHGKDFISVQEEITHVSNYLYIPEDPLQGQAQLRGRRPGRAFGLPRAQADFAAARRKRHLPRHQAEAGRRHDRRHGADVGGGASHHRAGRRRGHAARTPRRAAGTAQKAARRDGEDELRALLHRGAHPAVLRGPLRDIA